MQRIWAIGYASPVSCVIISFFDTLLKRRANLDQLVESLCAIVGRDRVLSDPAELLVYECDGLPQHKHIPRAVVFPSSTEETAEVMRILARAEIPFTPRGAGTGLSGGALALNRGVVIELARMRKILSIDEENRIARVQTGVVNLHVSRAVAHLGLHYVPDPSSQSTCTIGGNIAENAGGIHCLKYGTTTDHILGARVVLAGGDIVDLSGGETETAGYDLLGVFVGAEGTFGIATEATLRLVPIPPSIRTLLAEFAEVNEASHAVSAIIAAGVLPAALEMMDHEIIRAVEASVFAAGLPPDAGAALLIELDGLEAGIDAEAARVKGICLQHGARSCRLAYDETERQRLWAARKGAFGAIGRIAPDSMIQDAVVPRSRLPEVLDASYQIAAKYQLRLANVFHAGDGNLHPLICFDSRSPEEVHRVKEAGRELMEVCVRAGGSITGEHGVGLDKRDLLSLVFSEKDMDVMLRVRAAFDPLGLCNPGKIVPMLRGCGEARNLQQNGRGELILPDANGTQLHADGSPDYQNEIRHAGKQAIEEQRVSAKHGRSSNRATTAMALSRSDAEIVAKELSQIVGHENVSATLRPSTSLSSDHLVSSSSSTSSPPAQTKGLLTVAPGSAEEACEVIKLVSRLGWSVIPCGAATWVNPVTRPEQSRLFVTTRRLCRMLEHEPADLVATAEAGITLTSLNNQLARNHQWLPLDPPDDGCATIGGVVGTGVRGIQSLGYGPPRRYVIGMKVVMADGNLVKAGGRVVKNVAGYDLCKLFTGSRGSLGLITEITFKLRPLPAETRTVFADGSCANLIAAARELLAARVFPVAVEVLSPDFALAAKLVDEPESHLLMIRFAGSLESVTYQTQCTSELLAAHKVSAGMYAENDQPLWSGIAAVPARFSDNLVWRINVLPALLPKFLVRLSQRDKHAPQPLWQASLAEGSVRVIETFGDSNIAEVRSFLEKLQSDTLASGGSFRIDNGSAFLNGDLSFRQNSASNLMLRVKEQLDPQEVFSPGVFANMEID